jgi:hypothetical protein
LIDIWLRQLIESAMRPDADLKAIFENRGALDSFSNRITIAFALKLIGTGLYFDLRILRDIRNAFAHAPEALDFDNAEIKAKCDALWLPQKIKYQGREDPKSPREKFIRATTLILDAINEYLFRMESGLKSDFIQIGPPLNQTQASPPKQRKTRVSQVEKYSMQKKVRKE